DSGPHPAEAAVSAAPAEGLREEAVGPEGGNAFEAGEDSDFGPADEDGAEEPEAAGDVIVDAHHFPMVGFRFTFLDLVHSLLHLVHYNNHILVRPRPLQLNVPPAPPAATAAHESQGSSSSSSEEEATWETAEEPEEEEPAATE
uniref:cancer/testis antigen 47A-like n=1 Tax=Panthera onca TaxID=9690 RepID=UPI002953F127